MSESLISIVIPCFNEKRTIQEIVSRVNSLTNLKKEIIVIDDCSNDGTRQILKGIESLITRVVYHDRNMGKGAALRSGLKFAKGEIIVIQDADLEYDVQDIPRLIAPILDDKADVVFGSRFVGSSPHRVLFFWHMFANTILTTLSNMFTNINLSDMETCYKAFKKDIIQSIVFKENRFGFEPEFTAKVSKMGCRIYEIGIAYNGRTYSEGKKIRFRDALWALYCIVKYNLF